MYQMLGPSSELGELGQSLKPPSWLRNIVGAVVKGTKVEVPTPAGPITYDLGSAVDLAALKKMLTGAKVSTSMGPKPTGAMEQFQQTVEQKVPGGWLTIAAVGLAAFLILPRLLRRA